MNAEIRKNRSVVRRSSAENYLLISLVAFGVTVIAIRVFLQLTGFPQIGNSVLHIAHALWGGLILFAAALLPLLLANRWAVVASALLNGIGTGLFIDEVGKFITQSNDYFFPPALPFIYGFFLLTVFFYLYFRRPPPKDSRAAMYHVLEGLKDVLDGDLDPIEASRIESQLEIAKLSERKEIVSLADSISAYMQSEQARLVPAEPGFWRSFTTWLDDLAIRLGRRWHHVAISGILVLWTLIVLSFIAILIINPTSLESRIVSWRDVLIAIQFLVGALLIIAGIAWFSNRERAGVRFAVIAFLLSLVALQTVYFYLPQFQALTVTLIQLVFLLIIIDYRRRYLMNWQSDN